MNIKKDSLIYTNKGIEKIENIKIDDIVINELGEKSIIKEINIIRKKDNNIYKIKLYNTIDNFYTNINTKILSIQNIDYELKNSEIPTYIENNSKNCKIKYTDIKNLTDFDYIGMPIIKFNDIECDNTEFYRFYGILMINNFINYIILNEDNKNTLGFLNKYLFNNNINYDITNKKDKIEIKFDNNIDNNIDLDLNEECSKQLLKGLTELYYNKNGIDNYINIKTSSKKLVYIFKNLLLKFGLIINIIYNNDNYYIIKIPKYGIINELYNIVNNDDINVNFFNYNNYIWLKIKSISKIDKFYGNLYNIETNDNKNILTDIGVIS